jgi:hypothetical protein
MMDQMGQQFAGMTSQMEAAMKNMSPAQRAQMEQLLKGKLGGAAVPTTAGTTYVAKGGGTVNGFRCTNYDGTREGQKVSEICAAQPGELKIAASDFQVTEKMREFLAGMMKALQGSPMAGMISDQTFTPSGVSGFPVQTITLRNGQPVQREQVKSVADATFTDADFSTGTAKQAEIPAAPGARGKAKGK